VGGGYGFMGTQSRGTGSGAESLTQKKNRGAEGTGLHACWRSSGERPRNVLIPAAPRKHARKKRGNRIVGTKKVKGLVVTAIVTTQKTFCGRIKTGPQNPRKVGHSACASKINPCKSHEEGAAHEVLHQSGGKSRKTWP